MAPGGVNFSAFLSLLLLVAVPHSLALQCKEHQYPFHDKCCSDCAPGQRMRHRCTATADTECSPCQDEYFSSQHHHSFCNSCTVCNTKRGSVEVKKCEKTSDRVCVCRAGFMPAGLPLGSGVGTFSLVISNSCTLVSVRNGNLLPGNPQDEPAVCSPCPEGTFSIGRNEKCQPWTNCSSLGRTTLRAGTEAQDALCSSPGTPPEGPGTASPALSPLSTTPRDNNCTATVAPSRPGKDPAVCHPTSPLDANWGSLSLLLFCLVLLMVSGMSILLLIIQAARKDTKRRPCGSNNQKDRSCRIPIQEEQIDSNSSLIKN